MGTHTDIYIYILYIYNVLIRYNIYIITCELKLNIHAQYAHYYSFVLERLLPVIISGGNDSSPEPFM